MPWSWKLPLDVSSPARPSDALAASYVHREASRDAAGVGEPSARAFDFARSSYRSAVPEPVLRHEGGDGSGVFVHTAGELKVMPIEEWPDRLLLPNNTQVSWSWTLPLPLDSPRGSRASASNSCCSPAHSCCSDIFSDVVEEDVVMEEEARSHEDEDRTFEDEHTPLSLLQVKESRGAAALPWSWTLPMNVQSPRVTLTGALPADDTREQVEDTLSTTGGSGSTPSPVPSPVRSRLLLTLRSVKGNVPRILELVVEAELQACGDKRFLAEVYIASVDSYGPVGEPPPESFCDLCVKCMRVLCQADPSEAREFHNRWRVSSVGRWEARLYEARASLEERLGNRAKAVKVLREGLRVGARPAGLLQRTLDGIERACRQQQEQTRLAASTPNGLGQTPPSVRRRSDSPRAQSPGSPQSHRHMHTATLSSLAATDITEWERRAAARLQAADASSSVRAAFGGQEAAPGAAGPVDMAALQHQVIELQLENQHLRQQVQEQQPVVARQCPRCCREAVGGAVCTLLDETCRAVEDAFPSTSGETLEATPATWKEKVVEEIWSLLSTGGCAASVSQPLGGGGGGGGVLSAVLPALSPLRVRLRCAAAHARPDQEADDEAAVAAASPSRGSPERRMPFSEAVSPERLFQDACEQPLKELFQDACEQPLKARRAMWERRTPTKQAMMNSADAAMHGKENLREAPMLNVASHTRCLETKPAGAGRTERGAWQFLR